MVNYKAHLAAGLFICAGFAAAMNHFYGWYESTFWNILLVTFVAAVSSLVPDLDHENGKLHEIIIGTGLLLSIVGLVMYFFHEIATVAQQTWVFIIGAGVCLASLSFFGAKIAKHRGFLHSIPFCVMYALVVFAATKMDYQLGTLAFVGCYSHLVMDKLPFKMA